AAHWPALPAWPTSPLRLFVTAMTVLPVVFLLSPREVGGEVAERQRRLRGGLRARARAGGRRVRARGGAGPGRARVRALTGRVRRGRGAAEESQGVRPSTSVGRRPGSASTRWLRPLERTVTSFSRYRAPPTANSSPGPTDPMIRVSEAHGWRVPIPGRSARQC